MKIGIIGSSGFIGRYLFNEFLSQSTNDITTWKRATCGDFLSKESQNTFLQSTTFDLIYLLAWTSVEDISYRANPANFKYAQATVDFISNCLDNSVNVVVLGTSPDSNVGLNDEYSIAKSFLHSFVSSLNSDRVSLVKPTFVFSVEEKRPHLFRSVINWIQAGKNIDNFPLRTPHQFIDLIHVKDVAECLYHFSKVASRPRDLVLASGISVTVKDVARLLNAYLTKQILTLDSMQNSEFFLNSLSNFPLFNKHTKLFFQSFNFDN